MTSVVTMGNGSFPSECNCLEPTMRVPAHAALASREWLEILGWAVVHQDKRTQTLGREVLAREIGGNVKAIADPVKFCTAMDGFYAPGAVLRFTHQIAFGGRGRRGHCGSLTIDWAFESPPSARGLATPAVAGMTGQSIAVRNKNIP
jgi:hypothetical protein